MTRRAEVHLRRTIYDRLGHDLQGLASVVTMFNVASKTCNCSCLRTNVRDFVFQYFVFRASLLRRVGHLLRVHDAFLCARFPFLRGTLKTLLTIVRGLTHFLRGVRIVHARHGSYRAEVRLNTFLCHVRGTYQVVRRARKVRHDARTVLRRSTARVINGTATRRRRLLYQLCLRINLQGVGFYSGSRLSSYTF